MDGVPRTVCTTNEWNDDDICETLASSATGRRRKTGSTPRLHLDRSRTHGRGQLLLCTASAVLLSSVQNAHLVQAKSWPWEINAGPGTNFAVRDDRFSRAESRTRWSSPHARTPSAREYASTAAARRSGKCRLGCNISLVARIPRGGTSEESGADIAASKDVSDDLPNGQHNVVEDADEQVASDGDELDQAHAGEGVDDTEDGTSVDAGDDPEDGVSDGDGYTVRGGEGEEGGGGEPASEEEEEEEVVDVEDGGDEEEGSPDGEGKDVEKRPTAPLFSFPPGPRVDRTSAEESIQDVLPVQQRLVKYLTEDKVFGAQILCSLYFVAGTVAYAMDSKKYGGCYQVALATLMMKQWGTVLGRLRRVLVPHLLYEPHRYAKYRARVSALAMDPAVQTIIYCFIFLFVPLGKALVAPLLKETVYLLWVAKEVLQIISPGLVDSVSSFLEAPMSVFMTAGRVKEWRDMPRPEKRVLIGRRVAQACFKIEMVLPFAIALGVLPGLLQSTLAGTGVGAAEGGGDGASATPAESGGLLAQLGRVVPLANLGLSMVALVKLLSVRNKQLEDDVKMLRGLKVRGYDCDWVEQVADSVVFGKMIGYPWWTGLVASVAVLVPKLEATQAVLASDNKLRTLGATLFNLAIGRRPGAGDEDDDGGDEGDDGEHGAGDHEGDEGKPQGKFAKAAKVVAVATGLTDQ